MSGSADGDVRVWNMFDGVCVHILLGHTAEVVCLVGFRNTQPQQYCVDAFGDIIASGSADTTIRLWNITSGHCLYVLHGHAGIVRTIKVSLDVFVVSLIIKDGSLEARQWG